MNVHKMREFGKPAECQSASSNVSEAPRDGPNWVSEDSGRKVPRRERQEKQKSRHRRHHSVENAPDQGSRDDTTLGVLRIDRPRMSSDAEK
ncbi:hypothetical protein L1987_60384 [Smallanthus sonchifolius]|uniref:Uncharacterized protein n=1 Tax=Smallanthus sonchifolius TaxID=185202 RepID=A0ACB9D8U8_9ASTR|nr:hypothetical protein L1987_60384 [Smallanthus sonchifolius]